MIVQCKNPRRRNKKVAASQIKELLGVHVIHRTDRLMFFTTTDFSAAALKTAKASCLDIELINRSQIFERLRNVYRLEVSSMDIVDRELEERTGILEAAKGSGMSTDLVNRSYEHQQRVSVPYYMNSQLNAWLISLGQRALADSRIGFVTLKAPDG